MNSAFHWIGFNILCWLPSRLILVCFTGGRTRLALGKRWLWSGIWIGAAALFALGVYHFYGPQPALEFSTGYLIEKSLSVDNLFVFLVLFRTFGVPAEFQHRVLAWGILGALIMRGVMIAVGRS